MNRVSLILAGVVGLVSATAASAQTYDAFSSFNGTQLAGNFIYGEADPANPATSGTFFSANTNCFIAGSTCLQAAPNGDVPGVTKSLAESFQYGTVNVPDDRLLVHPGRNSLQTYLAFVAPVAGIYSFQAFFNVQDVSPTGVGINLIRTTSGGLPLIFTPIGTLGSSNTTFAYSGSFALDASEAFGFGIDNAGNVNNDSTGVNFSVTAVPEPATWAMMIVGFGFAGWSLRRRTARGSRVALAG